MIDLEEGALSDQSSGRVADPELDEEPEWIDSEGEENIEKLPKLKHDGRATYIKYATQVTDATKYYVFARPMKNHVQTLWKKTDRRKHMADYRKAVKTTKVMQ